MADQRPRVIHSSWPGGLIPALVARGIVPPEAAQVQITVSLDEPVRLRYWPIHADGQSVDLIAEIANGRPPLNPLTAWMLATEIMTWRTTRFTIFAVMDEVVTLTFHCVGDERLLANDFLSVVADTFKDAVVAQSPGTTEPVEPAACEG